MKNSWVIGSTTVADLSSWSLVFKEKKSFLVDINGVKQ